MGIVLRNLRVFECTSRYVARLRSTIGICLLSAIMFPGIHDGHLKSALSDLQHQGQLTDQKLTGILELISKKKLLSVISANLNKEPPATKPGNFNQPVARRT